MLRKVSHLCWQKMKLLSGKGPSKNSTHLLKRKRLSCKNCSISSEAARLKLEKGVLPGTVTDLVNLRSFYHYRIWRSVGIQANYELNYGLPRVEQPVEGLIKEWTTSGLVGIRNEQPFFKKLGGYVTIQYDFLHQPENPNGRWVVRFGFRLQNRQR